MKRLSELKTKYLRKDNQGIWMPLIGAIVLQYTSVLVNEIFAVARPWYWILFGVSIIAGFVFIALSIKYVEDWNRRLALFNIDENDFINVGSFLIAMSERNDFNHYNLSKLSVKYTLGAKEEYTMPGNKIKCFFPFTVEGSVEGTASDDISAYKYHMIANPNNRRDGLIKLSFKDDNGAEKQIDMRDGTQKQIKCYTFKTVNHCEHQNIHYEIKTEFLQTAGISTQSGGRLFLYPSNYSKSILQLKEKNTHITVVVPKEYDQFFAEPTLRVLGERDSQGPLGRCQLFSNKHCDIGGGKTFSCDINSTAKTLILVEFERKE